MATSKYDLIDILSGVGALCVTAANMQTTFWFAVPMLMGWYSLYWYRRTDHFQNLIETAATKTKTTAALPILLPPQDLGTTLRQTAPIDVNVVNKPDTALSSWFDRVTRDPSVDTGNVIANAYQTRKLQALDVKPEKQSTKQNMTLALAQMPKMIMYNNPKIPDPPTSTSVLVGYDALGKRLIWADFGKHGDTIHAFVAGQIGAGKDTELRMWFTQLTVNNTPDEVQFIIIDAKGEWITPSLADSLHMFVPPVGGFDVKIEKNDKGKRQLRDLANEAIEDALIDAIELLQERRKEFERVGATNIQAYERKTGKQLPLLFIIATDVGTNLDGILEKLIEFVVLKGRSFGVRAIISLQNASGESTGWRGNMGLVMSGYQGQSTSDKPNLGIPVPLMKYRPSELPSVDIPANRGLFVVRKGIEQYVVRAAFLPDELFEEYCETKLPRKTNQMLLSSLLSTWDEPKVQEVIKPAAIVAPVALTREQSMKVAELAAQGIAPSNITKLLGFTSNKRYNEMMPLVLNICKVIQTRKALLKGK